MDIRFKFMRYRKIASLVSISLFVVSILSLGLRGLSLGLDFSGGTLIEVSYESPVSLQSIRNNLQDNGYPDSQVVNFGTNLDVLIKVADQSGNSSVGEDIFNILNNQEIPIELKRVEFVGPQVGDELRDQGGLGMIVALFMILMYVAFRFQYKFALGAVSALAHDVVIILGIFSIFGWDFDLTVLAALLAVIGYSLNDTIVVSDRIRENFRTERVLDPIDLIDLSLNQTLGRTLVTSFTTLLVLFALFIFGGELIKGFSLALILGVLIGTYSSIYVVANMLMSLALIILGIFSIFGWDFDLTVLAALLAVIGYSLNDTIVVSDRIRENFRTERVLDPIDLIDLSLNQTLGRTLVTSLTTLLVLFALFIFGGELIKGFSLALILGVLIGTYSSIYVVANMLMSLALTKDDLAVPEPEGADFDGMP